MLVAANHGTWSVLLFLAALGTALSCLRDCTAARRLHRLPPAGTAGLVPEAETPWTVLVTGATGFIGQRLVAALQASGHRVVALVRDPAGARRCPPRSRS